MGELRAVDEAVSGQEEPGRLSLTLDRFPQGLAALLIEGQRALDLTGDDLSGRAAIHAALAFAHIHSGEVPKAVPTAHEAVTLAKGTGAEQALAEGLAALELAYFLMARGMSPSMMERAVALEGEASQLPIEWRPRMVHGCLLQWTDQFDEARTVFHALLSGAEERLELAAVPHVQARLAQLECWAGNWLMGERLATEAYEAASRAGHPTTQAFVFHTKADLDAHLGRVDTARDVAQRGLSASRVATVEIGVLGNLAVLGFLELSLSNWAQADGFLGSLADRMAAAGMNEIGVERFFPDEIEALITLGDLDRATSLLDHFSERAKSAGRPWGLATQARCRGLMAGAQGDLPGAIAALEEALGEHQRLPMPFEWARTLLAMGEAQRSAGNDLASLDHLQRALTTFTELGAPLWSERAKAGIGRVEDVRGPVARGPAPGGPPKPPRHHRG